MKRRAFLASLGAGAVAASTAGCVGAGTSAADGDYDVGMTAIAFEPEVLTVRVGETVTWRNTNSRSHTVTAYGDDLPADADYFASGGFDSRGAAADAYFASATGGGRVVTGGTFEHTFETPGQHPYFCIPHEQAGMVGVVVVEPADAGNDSTGTTS